MWTEILLKRLCAYRNRTEICFWCRPKKEIKSEIVDRTSAVLAINNKIGKRNATNEKHYQRYSHTYKTTMYNICTKNIIYIDYSFLWLGAHRVRFFLVWYLFIFLSVQITRFYFISAPSSLRAEMRNKKLYLKNQRIQFEGKKYLDSTIYVITRIFTWFRFSVERRNEGVIFFYNRSFFFFSRYIEKWTYYVKRCGLNSTYSDLIGKRNWNFRDKNRNSMVRV